LPAREQRAQLVRRARAYGAAKQLAGARWRPGPLVEHRDRGLATRKALVKDWKVADDDGQKAKSGSGLDDAEESRQLGVGQKVPETERREHGGAHVEIVQARQPVVESRRPQEQREAGDEEAAPQDDQHQQRDRSVGAQETLSAVAQRHPPAQRGPWLARQLIEDLGQANAGDSARQNDSHEGVAK